MHDIMKSVTVMISYELTKKNIVRILINFKNIMHHLIVIKFSCNVLTF